MSPKFLNVAALCCVLALCGCEKKTQEQPSTRPVNVVRARPAIPPGMAPLDESGTLFIDTQPLAVGQYVEYLRGTGLPVPEKWAGLKPDSPQAGDPVTGLDRAEAARCATWFMKRIPTLKEWQEAVRVVGARPYPWLEDGQPVPQGAPILFVRDWRAKTQGEIDAREAKAALAKTILDESQAKFNELRGALAAEVKTRLDRQQARWEEFKPAFFELVDKEQQVAGAKAAREGRETALKLIDALIESKGRLAIALRAQDLPAEEQDKAVEAYAQTVGQLRTQVQELHNQLTTGSAALQKEVMEETRAIEQAGAPEKNATLTAASALLARFANPPDKTAEVIAANEALSDMMARVEAAPEALSKVPSIADLRNSMAGLDEELTKVAAAEPTADALQAEKERLARIGAAVDRQVVQEGILLTELGELIELKATRASLQTRAEALKEMLAQR